MDKELANLILSNLTNIPAIQFFEDYAQARIARCHKEIENCRPEDLGRVQGRIAELKLLSRIRQDALAVKEMS